MSDNKFYESSSFWSGAGFSYIVLWVFSFYPAFILSLTARRIFFGITEEAEAAIFGFLAMVVLTFVILILAKCKQYFIVLMFYLLTLWPFLYILKHWWDNSGEMNQYPLPLDWWILW